MNKSKRKIPKFKNEGEEFRFWSGHDSTDFFAETEELKEKVEFSRSSRKKQRITMLLDERLKAQLQRVAQEKGIPYQTLIQVWLRERMNQEIRSRLAS